MTPEQRINICRLIEKMELHKIYCEKIGLKNLSTFEGRRIEKEEEKR